MAIEDYRAIIINSELFWKNYCNVYKSTANEDLTENSSVKNAIETIRLLLLSSINSNTWGSISLRKYVRQVIPLEDYFDLELMDVQIYTDDDPQQCVLDEHVYIQYINQLWMKFAQSLGSEMNVEKCSVKISTDEETADYQEVTTLKFQWTWL